MASSFYKTAHTLASKPEVEPTGNHLKTASMTPEIKKEAKRMGLSRVAGNVFRSHSTKDFWKIRNGKLIRLSQGGIEDNGESISGADPDNPEEFTQFASFDLTLY